MARKAAEETQAPGPYTVAIRFQDINGLKAQQTQAQIEAGETPEPLFYEVGDDVSHFEQERLDAAVERGTVVYNAPKDDSEAK